MNGWMNESVWWIWNEYEAMKWKVMYKEWVGLVNKNKYEAMNKGWMDE